MNPYLAFLIGICVGAAARLIVNLLQVAYRVITESTWYQWNFRPLRQAVYCAWCSTSGKPFIVSTPSQPPRKGLKQAKKHMRTEEHLNNKPASEPTGSEHFLTLHP
ncbi:hypothetical protein [Bifidobacterium cuniculi]|uniref:Uncharacterized protein n=1 Tax=Bifidobacterium cuniculi TaxID=1688 RepID=A0A087B510_9BIFI|nr:hypothetical protein [Bifidobacterium cuniculi]KFI66110.1 hypothetical protein BCUN_0614 [Bifidobacterium cuniculi]